MQEEPKQLASAKLSTPSIPASIPGTASSSLQVVLEQWKQLNLEGQRNGLDAEATEIGDNQDASLKARKVLAEETRAFKKNSDGDKAKFGSLLKLYQDEIDKLTKRSKHAEKAFLTLYKQLVDISDPVAALSSAVNETQKLSRIESENRKLQKELDDFKKDYSDVKNQDVTVRRLQEKIKHYETKLEEMIASSLQTSLVSVNEEHQRELDRNKERERELVHQKELMKQELTKTQTSHELIQSQLIDVKSKYDEDLGAKQLEVELLANEVERVSARVLALERENDSLLDQNAESKKNRTSELELQLVKKELEVSQLAEEVSRLQTILQSDAEKSKTQISTLNTQLEAERKQSEQLRQDLENGPKMQELEAMKKQLEVYKSLDYSVDASESGSDTVERILKEKNRSLENENTKLKVTISAYEKDMGELKRRLMKSEEVQNDQQRLITQLEDDLSHKVQTNSTPNATGSSGLASSSATMPITSVSALTSSSANLNPGSGDDSALLSIAISQRDRFKARIQELETIDAKLKKQNEQYRAELESFRSDNVKLYQTMKYLESYNTGDNRRRQTDVESANDTDLTKYKKMYEESMNPFEVFNKREKDRRVGQLKLTDRVTLSFGRFFLSNPYARTFIFVYTVLLHFVIFIGLYAWALTNRTCYTPPPRVD